MSGGKITNIFYFPIKKKFSSDIFYSLHFDERATRETRRWNHRARNTYTRSFRAEGAWKPIYVDDRDRSVGGDNRGDTMSRERQPVPLLQGTVLRLDIRWPRQITSSADAGSEAFKNIYIYSVDKATTRLDVGNWSWKLAAPVPVYHVGVGFR